MSLPGLALLLASTGATGPSHSEVVDVRSVIVDVAVIDRSSGRFVRGLGSDDFIVYVEGEPVTLDSAREVHHTVEQTTVVEPAPAPVTATEPTAATEPLPLPVRRFTFLFDVASASRRHVGKMWRGGKRAAAWARDNLRPEDRVTVAVYDRRLRILVDDQPFTPATEQILVTEVRRPADTVLDALLNDSFCGDPITGEIDREMVQYANDAADSERAYRLEGLLRALTALAGRLEGRDGRKAVLLFSEGYPMSLFSVGLPGGFSGDPERQGARTARGRSRFFVEQLRRRFHNADAAIFALHTGGLDSGVVEASELPRSGFSERGFVEENQSRSVVDIWNEQDALGLMARETGGQLVRNTANLAVGLQRAVRELTSYYHLSFTPKRGAPGSFHRIRVMIPGERGRGLG